jgi:beta-lactamase class D
MRRTILIAGSLLLALTWSACTINNVENASGLKNYFDSAHVSGTFCVYDNVHGAFTVYNKDRYVHRFPPGSSFKLMSTLIGLENGKLFDKGSRIGNDSLVDAFRGDSVAWFQELARMLGKDTLAKRIVAISYGNMDTTGTADSLYKLEISPDEQLGLVKKMYFNQLQSLKKEQQFQKRTIAVVKDIMQRESSPIYNLSYVTGTAKDSTGAPIAWVIGWEEERQNPYFFVLNITGAQGEDVGAKAEPLLKSLLTDQGFFKGLK